ncbi:MAG: beta-lactamase family protein [Sphingomonas sp.]|uniref:serine hydrolase domain-containing protein n=1 Tax=Sphingomonas sp. TaxID=28214 RepID=UPI0025E3B54D|nr:serine hydrolase domain-containing protein [Sphingomonas sp.]MBX9881740.1 beta-lactamase family protein [Sphingomonas sp.]
MTRRFTVRTLALALPLVALPLVAVEARQALRQSAPVPAPAALTQSRGVVDSYVRQNRAPGVVAAIGLGQTTTILKAGKLSFEGAAPTADENTLWRVYSMTKPITAMAAMILIEEGKLKLDQPISDFFPAYKNMRVLTDPDKSLESVPAKNQITVRHLMTHTAGLGYTIVTKGPLLAEYEKNGITPFTSTVGAEVQARKVRPPSLRAFAERVATLPLIAEPGTKWSYSIGLDVLGAVIEKASGMPFDSFLQTRIFTPLKMNSTYFQVPAADASRLITGYAFFGENPIPIDPGAQSAYLQPPSFPYGGAGLVMSAADYDRFLHMLQNGGELDGARVMKPQTVALALSNLLPAGVTYPGAVPNTGGAPGPSQGFGAGGSVYLVDIPGGPSKGTYGWGGAAGTIAWVDRARQLRVTVMVNYIPGERWPLRSDFSKAFYADIAR